MRWGNISISITFQCVMCVLLLVAVFLFSKLSQQRFRITDRQMKRGTTEGYFTGDKIRDSNDLDLSSIFMLDTCNILMKSDSGLTCKFWAVVTTIFEASEPVRKVVRRREWCLVIVGDQKSPPKNIYLADIGAVDATTVVFLSTDDQELMFPLLSKAIPWNHISRKNIGYAFAMIHGAKFIWDFDDDNENIVPADLIETMMIYRTPCKNMSHHLFNPYPYFVVNESYTWPRGFPLQHIRNTKTIPKLCYSSETRNIGVVQSLANIQPDVDAIYRFTRETPFVFGAIPGSHLPIMVPSDVFTPFNGQATLWTQQSFKYLALPVGVTGRVADIWRSYIAQYFFHKHSQHVLFVPPYVDQHRNIHDILKDFNDELDIYQKSDHLLHILVSLADREIYDMIELYKLMYERSYLEEEDIHFIVAWTKTFEHIQTIISNSETT